jgi:hypothetical protein
MIAERIRMLDKFLAWRNTKGGGDIAGNATVGT